MDRDEAGRKTDGVCRNDILKQVHLEEHRFLSNNEVQCALIIVKLPPGNSFVIS